MIHGAAVMQLGETRSAAFVDTSGQAATAHQAEASEHGGNDDDNNAGAGSALGTRSDSQARVFVLPSFCPRCVRLTPSICRQKTHCSFRS